MLEDTCRRNVGTGDLQCSIEEACIRLGRIHPIAILVLGFEHLQRQALGRLRSSVFLDQALDPCEGLCCVFQRRLPPDGNVLEEIGYPNSSTDWMRCTLDALISS